MVDYGRTLCNGWPPQWGGGNSRLLTACRYGAVLPSGPSVSSAAPWPTVVVLPAVVGHRSGGGGVIVVSTHGMQVWRSSPIWSERQWCSTMADYGCTPGNG